MGGRSGQSIRTGRGNRLPQQRQRERLEKERDEINDEMNRNTARMRQLIRQDSVTPEERREFDQLGQRQEALRDKLDETNNQIRELERQEAEEKAKQDADSYKDYNATVSINGTNQFPQFSSGQFLSFTGVPKDFGGNIRIDYNSSGASVYIDGEGVTMRRQIFFDNNGNPNRVYNAYFRIEEKTQHDGRGAEIFSNQVNSLKSAGFKQIDVSAAGAHDDNAVFNGYYTWARFGYVPDNPTLGVAGYNRYAEQEGFEKVSTFKEIMYTESGRDWWKNKGGVSFSGTFNLQDNSYSMTTLKNYMKERSNRNR